MFLRPLLISTLAISIGLVACTSLEKRQAEQKQQEQQQLEQQEKVRQAAVKAQRDAEVRLFTQLKPAELRALVQEAVVYGYPLVLMDTSKQVMTSSASYGRETAAVNEFSHSRKIPDASYTGAVSPSVDTLPSSAWVDLSNEPIVLSVPATGQRYYTMSILDGWTNVFASPGTRTTGNGAGNYVIVGPNWQGQIPVNVQKIQAPSNMVLIVAHTFVKGPKDSNLVHAIQNRYRLTPLSQFYRTMAPVAMRPAIVMDYDPLNLRDTPMNVVASMDAQTFLTRLSHLMKDNPPAAEDRGMLENLAKIGVTPGQTVDFAQLPEDVKKSLDQAVRGGFERVAELAHNVPGRIMNGWVSGTELGSYGSNYEARAAIAWMGLGANLPEDAIYPTARVDGDGVPLRGTNKYVLHFAKGQLPPANAFWSVTMYNSRQNFVVNPMNRYSLGSKSKLRANKDGSTNIYIQTAHPGKAKLANWLPAPQGEFNLMMRLYWPKQAALNGEWRTPGVQKLRPLRQRPLAQRTAKITKR